MFDALKWRKRTTKSAEEQRDELQALIDTAREERGALSTMLTQIEVRAPARCRSRRSPRRCSG